MTETDTDKRVAELSGRVDFGFEQTTRSFEQTNQRIDDLRSEMHHGFDRVDADIRELRSAIGSLQRLMIGFFATTLGAIIAGVIVNVILLHF